MVNMVCTKMHNIEFKSYHTYIVKGVLPRTNEAITLGIISSQNVYNVILKNHLQYYSKIVVLEYSKTFKTVCEVDAVLNNNAEITNLNILLNSKNNDRILGNIVDTVDEDVFYMRASHNKKRVLIKLDISELELINRITKNRYHFIAREFKSTNQVCFIKMGRKRRKHSLYSYIFGKTIDTQVIHIDGNIYNYCKNNLLVTNKKTSVGINQKSTSSILEDIPLDRLVGFKRSSDRNTSKYVAKATINGHEIKIGRFNDPYEAAMAYDLTLAYYKGPVFTVNYPYEYYATLKQDLVSKWNDNLAAREITKKIKLAR